MRRGVTLLEVLVAATLLSVGLLAALEVVAGTAGATRRVEDRQLALMAARSKMEEILKEPVLQTGSDRGENTDDTTDYDWEALIEPSAHPGLVMVTVIARNRVTGYSVSLSALRRPDLESTPEDETGSGLETDLEASEGTLQ